MEPTFNLSALAKRLRSEGRMLSYAQKIETARDLQSLHTDLKIAGETMHALQADLTISAGPNDHGRQVTQLALIQNAILLYARATKSASKTRKTYQIDQKFTYDEKLVHAEIVGLRDDAIAHYGNGKNYSGEWQAEIIILQFKLGAGRTAGLGRRQIVDPALCDRVSKQIERAKFFISEIWNEANNEVTRALDDQDFFLEVQKHPLNLELFLSSIEAAEAVRASNAPGGQARGYIAKP